MRGRACWAGADHRYKLCSNWDQSHSELNTQITMKFALVVRPNFLNIIPVLTSPPPSGFLCCSCPANPVDRGQLWLRLVIKKHFERNIDCPDYLLTLSCFLFLIRFWQVELKVTHFYSLDLLIIMILMAAIPTSPHAHPHFSLYIIRLNRNSFKKKPRLS